MDHEHQPAVKKPKVIADRIEQLVRLHNKAKETAEEEKEAIVKAGEDSGYPASVVRKFVVARAGENFEEKKRQCELQMELFEEVGE